MKRFLLVVGTLLLAGVLLVTGLYVAHGVRGSAGLPRLKRQAAVEVTAALPAAGRGADDRQRQVRRRLHDLGRPRYAWSELTCDLSTIDAGWIVQDWVQECEIRTVDLFPVEHAGAGDCQDLLVPDADVTRGRAAVLTARRPYRHYCPDGLVRPALLGTTRLLAGRRPRSLSSSPAWVVAQTHTPVSRTVLGCDPWAVPFCEEPVDGPVLPR